MTSHAADDTPVLFQTERQREIAKMTVELGRVEVAGLADRFNVTPETIRRDLSELQEHRLVRRVHGGAVVFETAGFEPLLSVRDERNTSEKRRIARRAVRIYPLLRAVRMVRSWGSLRIMTSDGHPIYERSLSCPGASLVTCHSGVTLAAVHSMVLAGWVAGETQPDYVEGFSAKRFEVQPAC